MDSTQPPDRSKLSAAPPAPASTSCPSWAFCCRDPVPQPASPQDFARSSPAPPPAPCPHPSKSYLASQCSGHPLSFPWHGTECKPLQIKALCLWQNRHVDPPPAATSPRSIPLSVPTSLWHKT